MIEEIKQIIERRNQLAQQASEQYQPGVSRLIMTNDRNSHAAVSYINIYREMWDEKGLKFGNKNNGNDKELAI